MTTTHPIDDDTPKLEEDPQATIDQGILDEIRRHNNGVDKGFFKRFFGRSPLDNSGKNTLDLLRRRFIPRLPESEEEPDLPGTLYHFLYSGTTEYSWATVQILGLELDAEFYAHDSGLVQLYKYARKVFKSQPARRFLHGIYILGLVAELWVFDRAGLYHSQPLNLRDHSEPLAAIFASYLRLDDLDLGMNPILHYDTIGTYILAKGENQSEPGLSQFYLEGEPIAYPKDIVSTRPTCYRARLSASTKPEFVIKFTWKVENSEPEDWELEAWELERWGPKPRRSEKSMLRLVKKRNVSGVMQMFSHQKVGPSCGLRGGGMEFPALKEQFGDTTFTFRGSDLECMVVYPLGRPLGRFHSMEEFLRGFRDAIAGYRSLHLDGKILHQDISPNNIMLTGDKKEGDPWGFLIDLDMSMELAVGPARPGEIIGTKAFMAIGVLKRVPRTYRQDLESFLYVFLWIAICGGDRKLPADSRIQRWMVGNWSELARKKTEDMEDGNFAELVAEFKPQFQSLKGLAYRLREIIFAPEPKLGDKEAEEMYSALIAAVDNALIFQFES
ncbi:uncharacterized protein NECHADRAFT_83171 [Fusarium vanettenii 77-13-4]|uniref:non-specific serine/threonine protein kinase n=1 Tax=Fusarium vanettenii (strain ATCC MYA-4622 / CBS 123669 / FGSC 9596 / NRRL 45880 / 77-13-4) TaxID=660122 RepID=C7ZBG4_FUSV7|nr:uncharacterized protein NECHADRAFT_83171 [Fusarium vanettenii 77-13-4]EEU38732.1 hypothetical protein NECHADRAFT_83171 [Fusarium vanettenii 77-13-4]